MLTIHIFLFLHRVWVHVYRIYLFLFHFHSTDLSVNPTLRFQRITSSAYRCGHVHLRVAARLLLLTFIKTLVVMSPRRLVLSLTGVHPSCHLGCRFVVGENTWIILPGECALAHWVTHVPSQRVTVLMQSRPTGRTTHGDVIYAVLCKWLTFHRAFTSG